MCSGWHTCWHNRRIRLSKQKALPNFGLLRFVGRFYKNATHGESTLDYGFRCLWGYQPNWLNLYGCDCNLALMSCTCNHICALTHCMQQHYRKMSRNDLKLLSLRNCVAEQRRCRESFHQTRTPSFQTHTQVHHVGVWMTDEECKTAVSESQKIIKYFVKHFYHRLWMHVQTTDWTRNSTWMFRTRKLTYQRISVSGYCEWDDTIFCRMTEYNWDAGNPVCNGWVLTEKILLVNNKQAPLSSLQKNECQKLGGQFLNRTSAA